MPRNEFAQFRSLSPLVVAGLAVTLTVLLAVPFAPTASAKDNPGDSTRIYTHTYDEVFQASQEAIERMGMFVTDKDKDKGTISGNGDSRAAGSGQRFRVDFEIHIEAVSTKPETRVSINTKCHKWAEKGFKADFLSELQRTLSTYK